MHTLLISTPLLWLAEKQLLNYGQHGQGNLMQSISQNEIFKYTKYLVLLQLTKKSLYSSTALDKTILHRTFFSTDPQLLAYQKKT